MSALRKRKVRFSADYRATFGSATLRDQFTAQGIETVRGNATRFEIAFYEGDAIADLSEVESLNLKIQPSQTVDGVLADQTLELADLDLTVDAESWADGTKQHAVFEFTSAEMNISPGGASRVLWLVVTAITIDGEELTLAAGNLTLHEDNNGSLATPPESPGAYLTVEQADARFVRGRCITRETDDGPPTLPLIRVTGTLAGSGGPVVFPDLSARGSLNGKEHYTDSYGSTTYSCRWETSGGARWILAGSDGTTARTWSSTQDVATPNLVTSWTPASGTTGAPTVTRHAQLPADAIGQDLRLGDASPYRWFKAAEISPTIWEEVTPGVILNRDTETPEKLFVEDSTLQTEVVTDGP